MKKILIDCDGVLADFTKLYLDLHFAHHNRAFQHHHVTNFDFTACIATKEQDDRIWRHIDQTPGLVRGLQWLPGAQDALEELRKLGRVICVTSPHHGPTWMPERLAWLREEAGFDKKDVIFASDKTPVGGACLIDDNTRNIRDWHCSKLRGEWAEGVLYSQPWNGKSALSNLRADSWEQVIEAAARSKE
jgi:5'(3')-deoxyribonucleotidase